MNNIKMSRRGLLGGLFAAAAVVSVPSVADAFIRTETDEARFMRLARTGRVEGQTFNFTKGVFIDSTYNGLVISKCKFTMLEYGDPTANVITFTEDVRKMSIINNRFDDQRKHKKAATLSFEKVWVPRADAHTVVF